MFAAVFDLFTWPDRCASRHGEGTILIFVRLFSVNAVNIIKNKSRAYVKICVVGEHTQ